jgi:dienelactone hydrolase
MGGRLRMARLCLGSVAGAGSAARRLARQGCFAVAPELFARQGDAQSYGEIAKLIAEVVSKTPDVQVLGDLDASLAWAAQQGADASRQGIIGFCWDGRIVSLYAVPTTGPATAKPLPRKAGRWPWTGSGPTDWLDRAAKVLKCPPSRWALHEPA